MGGGIRRWQGPAGLRLEMVYVPAGEFVMGRTDAPPDEQPRHLHRVARPYWISRRPVTQAQFRVYTDASGARWPRQGWFGSGDDLPVTRITWDEARAFCAWAGLALPSEAEWEKAARGVDGRLFPWGDDASVVTRRASAGPPLGVVTAGGWGAFVGAELAACERPGSPWGALDMVDGILEWCEDPYSERAYLAYGVGAFEPPAAGRGRVARGGAWTRHDEPAPATTRTRVAPDARESDLGFRPVLREERTS